MIKIGDKVIRTVGTNSGMKKGDIGTVIEFRSSASTGHIYKIKEYQPGWHVEMNLKKYTEEDKSVDWAKISKHLHKAILSEEKRRSSLDELKKQREELDKKIKDIEENQVTQIDTKELSRHINKMVNEDLISLDAFKKGRSITVIVSNSITNKTLGKGVATAMPNEKFDLELGMKLAYCRALENYWKKKVHGIIRETF